jgi:hypothetical protein
MKVPIWLILVTPISWAACHRGQPVPQPPPPPTPMPPPVVLYSDNSGGIQDSTRVVIRDDSTFARYWQQATSKQMDPPGRPSLDFDREMAILVAAGRMTPNDQIHVDSLLVRKETDPDGESVETLTIVVRTIEACRQMNEDAFPLEIVRARTFEGPVKWDWRKDPVCRDVPAP